MGRTIPDQMPEVVKRDLPTWRQRVACFFGHHEWVARVELGGEPDKARIHADPLGYFLVFAAPVCRHCPTQLPPRV